MRSPSGYHTRHERTLFDIGVFHTASTWAHVYLNSARCILALQPGVLFSLPQHKASAHSGVNGDRKNVWNSLFWGLWGAAFSICCFLELSTLKWGYGGYFLSAIHLTFSLAVAQCLPLLCRRHSAEDPPHPFQVLQSDFSVIFTLSERFSCAHVSAGKTSWCLSLF